MFLDDVADVGALLSFGQLLLPSVLQAYDVALQELDLHVFE